MTRRREYGVAPSFEELSAYMDNELDPARMHEIDLWLELNPRTQAELGRIRKIEKSLKSAARKQPPHEPP